MIYQPTQDTLPGAHMFVVHEGVHYRREQPERAILWRKAVDWTADYLGPPRPIAVEPHIQLEREGFDYSFERDEKIRFYVYAQTEREQYAVASCVGQIIHRLTTYDVTVRLHKNARRRMARRGCNGRRGARSVAATKMVQDTDYTAVRYIVSGNPGMWEVIARQVGHVMVGRV